MANVTRQIQCELTGETQTYRAVLDLTLKPIEVDELTTPVGYTIIEERLAPGRKIPNGNYVRQPHSFAPKESRVRVESGRLYAGWR